MVFSHYKNRVNNLRLLTSKQSDKEIEATLEKMKETLKELRSIIHATEPLLAFKTKLEELQNEFETLSNKDLKCTNTTKRKCPSSDSNTSPLYFSKNPNKT